MIYYVSKDLSLGRTLHKFKIPKGAQQIDKETYELVLSNSELYGFEWENGSIRVKFYVEAYRTLARRSGEALLVVYNVEADDLAYLSSAVVMYHTVYFEGRDLLPDYAKLLLGKLLRRESFYRRTTDWFRAELSVCENATAMDELLERLQTLCSEYREE